MTELHSSKEIKFLYSFPIYYTYYYSYYIKKQTNKIHFDDGCQCDSYYLPTRVFARSHTFIIKVRNFYHKRHTFIIKVRNFYDKVENVVPDI